MKVLEGSHVLIQRLHITGSEAGMDNVVATALARAECIPLSINFAPIGITHEVISHVDGQMN